MEFKHLLESLPLVGNVFRCVPLLANPVEGRPYHQERLQKSQIKPVDTFRTGCEARRAWRGYRVAHFSPPLSLQARRDGCSNEGAAGTDVSCFDPDDDERQWTGHDGNQTPCTQSSRGTVFRPELAGFARRSGHCDCAVNCSLFLLRGITGTCRKRSAIVSY